MGVELQEPGWAPASPGERTRGWEHKVALLCERVAEAVRRGVNAPRARP